MQGFLGQLEEHCDGKLLPIFLHGGEEDFYRAASMEFLNWRDSKYRDPMLQTSPATPL